MKTRHRSPSFTRLFPLAALVCLALSLMLPAQPAQATTGNGWKITSLRPSESETCVGQIIPVYGSYRFVTGPDDPLTPLVGPDRITTAASIGQTSPMNLFPGTPVADFMFDYVANHIGSDQISATLEQNGRPLTSELVGITVKEKCGYNFYLNAVMRTVMQGEDWSEELEWDLSSKGLLTPVEGGDSDKLISRSQIRLVMNVISYNVPHCTQVVLNPGMATGVVEVTADISSGYLVNVRFAPPERFDWVFTANVICDGKSQLVDVPLDLTRFTSEDPWVEQDFLPSGGTEEVRIPYFEGGLRGVRSGGGSGAYIALLTLRREKSR